MRYSHFILVCMVSVIVCRASDDEKDPGVLARIDVGTLKCAQTFKRERRVPVASDELAKALSALKLEIETRNLSTDSGGSGIIYQICLEGERLCENKAAQKRAAEDMEMFLMHPLDIRLNLDAVPEKSDHACFSVTQIKEMRLFPEHLLNEPSINPKLAAFFADSWRGTALLMCALFTDLKPIVAKLEEAEGSLVKE